MANPLAKPEWTAPVAEWNAEKGYGWLLWDGKRVFLHRSQLGGTCRDPKIGEAIQFCLGHDGKNRTCAINATAARADARAWGPSLLVFGALLVMPVVALTHQGVAVWKIAAVGFSISVTTYTAYALDKSRARRQAWRISEAHLHLLELLGGWPGAWLAQKRLRHKCTKRSYQQVFWLIVITHQLAALDALQDFRALRLMKSLIGNFITQSR